MVEITINNASYPREALTAHLQQLSDLTQSEIRGLDVGEVGGVLLKARFAVNGLINDQEPKLGIVPIVKAFSFGPEPLTELAIFFVDIVPSTSIPKTFIAEDGSWMLQGQASASPKGIEYRTTVKTKDPEKIVILSREEIMARKQVIKPKVNFDPIFISFIILASIAVGGLVYFALLKRRKLA
jgi:hypothetical protein